MNHFKISIFKSIIRILGSFISLGISCLDIPIAFIILALSYGVAEMLGILEELFDKRKE